MKNIGRSIIINALSVMAGFSVLMFSGFSSIRFFGYLVIVSISSCLAGAIVLIPSIILKFRPRFVSNNMSNPKKKHEKKSISVNIPAFAAFAGTGSTAGCRSDHE